MTEFASELSPDDWPITPPERRYRAERYDRAAATWSRCEYVDLSPGDVFRALSPDGEQIDALTGEIDDGAYALVDGPPIPNVERGEGWSVPIHVGSLEDMLAGATN